MYKKIAAGVLAVALTFGSAALPTENFDSISAGTVISAKAAESFGDYKYEVLDNGTVEITNYTGSTAELVIPSEIDGKTVTSIGKRAFDYSAMTSVTIPDTITNIGSFAFTYCTALETINIPESVTAIGENAFATCKKLKSITIPSSVTRIEDLTFNSCEALEKVVLPSGITYIGKNAFGRCTALKNFDIPASVTYIGPYAFSYDKDLEKPDIPAGVTYIGENAFLSNNWYENMPDGMIYFGKVAYKYKGNLSQDAKVDIKAGTVFVGENAFKNCALGNVTIPESVTKIGKSAFEGTKIKSVKLPSKLNEIDEKAFSNCSELEAIDIPASVKVIDDKAFQGCSKIESVVIPNGIDTISASVFSYCTNLKSVKIPDSVTEIDLYAFSGCKNLSDINVPSTVQTIQGGAFMDCAISSMEIPQGVKYINQYTFSGCQNLTSVKIPDSVIEIVHDAFNDCPKLANIEIPENVTEIGGKAFYKCDSLKTLKIPAAVTNMGTKSVGYCYNSETRKDYIPEDFTMVCTAGSAAEDYAVKNGINYTTTDAPVVKTDISVCTITLSGSKFDYTGKEIKPTVTVKNGDKTLTAGTDYTVVYSNNVNAGTATVTITGAGNYKGTVKKTFTIVKNDPVTKKISDCQITLSAEKFVYTGSAVKPKVTVKDGTKTLTVNTDYAIRYVNNVNVGTGSVVVAGRGNYTGSVTKTFSIVEEITDLSECSIKLNKTMFKSTGKAIKPRVIVKSGSKTLVSGTDYLVRYMNNVNPGTASVIVAGRGKYTGRVTLTFKILDSNAKDINQCSVTLNKTKFSYTGKAVKPRVTVKDGDTVLTATVDYNVKYVDNVNAGTAKVVVSGTGKYQGMVEKTFTIVK